MATRFSFPSRVVLFLAGVFAAGTIYVVVSSTVPIGRFGELISRVYDHVIRNQVVKLLLGTEVNLPWTGFALDILSLWVSLFIAINVFVYRNEGVLMWGHVRQNYCATRAGGLLSNLFCTFPKVLLSFLATPFVLLRMYIASIGAKEHTLFTACYTTLDPQEIARYLRLVGLGVGALVAAGAFLSWMIH